MGPKPLSPQEGQPPVGAARFEGRCHSKFGYGNINCPWKHTFMLWRLCCHQNYY